MENGKCTVPRFVINTDQNVTKARARHTVLSRRDKLQVFVELACYCDCDLQRFVDASDVQNRQQAERWLVTELTFLEPTEVVELRDAWGMAIADGANTRLLFSVVKSLQKKYAL